MYRGRKNVGTRKSKGSTARTSMDETMQVRFSVANSAANAQACNA